MDIFRFVSLQCCYEPGKYVYDDTLYFCNFSFVVYSRPLAFFSGWEKSNFYMFISIMKIYQHCSSTQRESFSFCLLTTSDFGVKSQSQCKRARCYAAQLYSLAPIHLAYSNSRKSHRDCPPCSLLCRGAPGFFLSVCPGVTLPVDFHFTYFGWFMLAPRGKVQLPSRPLHGGASICLYIL